MFLQWITCQLCVYLFTSPNFLWSSILSKYSGKFYTKNPYHFLPLFIYHIGVHVYAMNNLCEFEKTSTLVILAFELKIKQVRSNSHAQHTVYTYTLYVRTCPGHQVTVQLLSKYRARLGVYLYSQVTTGFLSTQQLANSTQQWPVIVSQRQGHTQFLQFLFY